MVTTKESSKKIYLVGDEVQRMDNSKCPSKRTLLANFLYLRLKKKVCVKV